MSEFHGIPQTFQVKHTVTDFPVGKSWEFLGISKIPGICKGETIIYKNASRSFYFSNVHKLMLNVLQTVVMPEELSNKTEFMSWLSQDVIFCPQEIDEIDKSACFL